MIPFTGHYYINKKGFSFNNGCWPINFNLNKVNGWYFYICILLPYKRDKWLGLCFFRIYKKNHWEVVK